MMKMLRVVLCDDKDAEGVSVPQRTRDGPTTAATASSPTSVR